MQNILIIGFGKLGSHLYQALKKSGKYKIKVIKKKSAGKKILSGFITKSDIVFICVQDSYIENTAAKIAALNTDLNKKIFFHTSGALTSDALAVLSKAGAETASFHPVQTFAAKTAGYSKLFRNIFIAIEGSKRAADAGYKIAFSAGAVPFTLKKKDKTLHHICCVMASNYLTVLASKIEDIHTKKIRINGFKQNEFLNIYIPLAKQTIENISVKNSLSALTGPIERNDLKTVGKHLDELKKTGNNMLMFYILMGIETVKLALKKKSINKSQANKLYKLFSNCIIKQ